MTLIFKEPETFKTPDNQEYVIIPVQADDMPLFFKIINRRQELYEKAKKDAKKQAKKDKKEYKEEEVDIRTDDFLEACGKDLTLLINKTVLNIKTGEPIPLQWRNPGNVISWMFSIIRITTPDRTQTTEGDDTPLRQAEKSSGKSSQAKPT